MDGAAGRKGDGFLDCFWQLGDADASKRSGAAAWLAAFFDGSATADDDKAKYALRRLVRGLASPRGEARQGFCAALSALVSSGALGPATVAAAVAAECTNGISTSQDKVEARLSELAELLATLAIGRAGVEMEDEVSAQLTSRALALMQKRKWLRETAAISVGWVLGGPEATKGAFLNAATALEAAIFGEPAADGVDGAAADDAGLALGDLGPDAVALVLVARACARRFCVTAAEFVERGALRLGDALLDQPLSDVIAELRGPLAKASATFPRAAHLAWDVLLRETCLVKQSHLLPEALFHAAGDDAEARAALYSIVDAHVEGGTLEQRGAALTVSQLCILGAADVAALDAALSPKVVKCLVGACGNAKSHLRPLCLKILRQISETRRPAAWRVACALRLLAHGDVRFDSKTRTKTIAKLLEGLDDAAARHYFRFAVESIFQPAADGADLPADLDKRLWGMDSVAALCRVVGAPCADELRAAALTVLMRLAFFDGPKAAADDDDDEPLAPSSLIVLDSDAAMRCVAADVALFEETLFGPRRQSLEALFSDGRSAVKLRAHAAQRCGAMLAEATRGELRETQLKAYARAADAWLELERRGARLNAPLAEEFRDLRDEAFSKCAALQKRAFDEASPDKVARALWSLCLSCTSLLLTSPGEMRLGIALQSVNTCMDHVLAGGVLDAAAAVDLAKSSVELLGTAAAAAPWQQKSTRATVARAWSLIASAENFDVSNDVVAVFVAAVCGAATEDAMDEDEDEDDGDDGDGDAEDAGESDAEDAGDGEEADDADEDGEAEHDATAVDLDGDSDADDIVVSGDMLADLLEDQTGIAMAQHRVVHRKSGRLESRKEALQLQLRCLDVLEKVVARSVESLSDAIVVLNPLITLVGDLEPDLNEANDLAARVQALIAKRLVKPTVDSESKAPAAAMLATALHASPKTPGHGAALEAACAACCRAFAAGAGGDDDSYGVAREAYASAFVRLVTSRKAKGGARVFEDLVQRAPALARDALLPAFGDAVLKAPSTFLVLRALDVLKALFNDAKRRKDAALLAFAQDAKGVCGALAVVLTAKKADFEKSAHAKRLLEAVDAVVDYARCTAGAQTPKILLLAVEAFAADKSANTAVSRLAAKIAGGAARDHAPKSPKQAKAPAPAGAETGGKKSKKQPPNAAAARPTKKQKA
ncbi:hypothetical protein M885DRAFT_508928 [Pelagophyceae sp. CCMP2097]|nr:hypothetical protein M885DRAFT_508928 [Pelagophyceae sp. CCMP2097]